MKSCPLRSNRWGCARVKRISRHRVGRPRVSSHRTGFGRGPLRFTSAIWTEVIAALTLVPTCCSKRVMLNQSRLDLRDPGFGLTQCIGACMHGVGA
jgi:hypothetical protein